MSEHVILLIEDNRLDEELTLRALRKGNVSMPIVVARDGVQALDYLFVRGAHASRDATVSPRLILLDLKLPRLDGLEVLRSIRADDRTKLIPVVVLTSSTEASDLIASYRLGANSYVRKPVDYLRFLEIARQLSEYWLAVNETAPSPRNGD
jgi:two-component system, response regulator